MGSPPTHWGGGPRVYLIQQEGCTGVRKRHRLGWRPLPFPRARGSEAGAGPGSCSAHWLPPARLASPHAGLPRRSLPSLRAPSLFPPPSLPLFLPVSSFLAASVILSLPCRFSAQLFPFPSLTPSTIPVLCLSGGLPLSFHPHISPFFPDRPLHHLLSLNPLPRKGRGSGAPTAAGRRAEVAEGLSGLRTFRRKVPLPPDTCLVRPKRKAPRSQRRLRPVLSRGKDRKGRMLVYGSLAPASSAPSGFRGSSGHPPVPGPDPVAPMGSNWRHPSGDAPGTRGVSTVTLLSRVPGAVGLSSHWRRAR